MADYLVDYAWNGPGPGEIKQAGYKGAIRYLSYSTGKNITPAERDSLQQEGLWIGLIWETTANRAGAGYQAGLSDAREANRQADTLGAPDTVTMYYAVDFDATLTQVREYFRGTKDASKRPTGVYGGLAVVDGLLVVGMVTHGWQTVAWSHHTISGRAHIFQRATGEMIAQGTPTRLPRISGDYDENVILQPDCGLWGATAPPPAPPPTAQEDDMPTVTPQDLAVDPADPSRGYVLDAQGALHPYGGAPPPADDQPYWSDGTGPARRVVILWTPTMAVGHAVGYTLDAKGAVHPFGGAVKPGDGGPFWGGAFVPPAPQS